MVQHLATLGETVAEPKVVGKFLRSVPHKYKQIVVAIQTLLDVETLTLANVSVNHADKLDLSEEAWEEKWKLQEGSGAGGSSSRGGGSGGRSANHGNGNGGNDRDSSRSNPPGPGKVGRDQCRKCGKKGHWARDCWSKPKNETAYTAQEEESLMLVTASPQIRVAPQAGTVQAEAAAATQEGADTGVGGTHCAHARRACVCTARREGGT
jgi:hypothetical protein